METNHTKFKSVLLRDETETLSTKESLLTVGEQSLVAKYGTAIDFKDSSLDWSLNGGFEEVEHSGGKHKIPIATITQVAFMEKWIRMRCAPYEFHISKLSSDELDAFTWNCFLFQDFNRGKMPGQIPHRIFRHSEEFLRWEDSILKKIEDRSNKLDIN